MSRPSRMPVEQQIMLLFSGLNEQRREHCLAMLAGSHAAAKASDAGVLKERAVGTASLWGDDETAQH